MIIQRIELPVAGFDEMQAEAQAEGYRFLETLLDEWASGENRFDGPGEMLCGGFAEGRLVAVGGLNCDPFLANAKVGRIRRVYVRREWRNQAIGGALLDHLLRIARLQFGCVRLRADNAGAARLYERKGFVRCQSETATHLIYLN